MRLMESQTLLREEAAAAMESAFQGGPRQEIVRVRRKNTALLCDVRMGGGTRQVVVKKIAPGPAVGGAEQLAGVIRRAQVLQEGTGPLAMPIVLAAHAEWLVLEYLPGRSLEETLDRCLGFPRARPHTYAFERAGGALRRIHDLDARACGLPEATPRPNSQYMPRLERNWETMKGSLPARFRSPESLYRYLPPAVPGRAYDRLLPNDGRPKNSVLTTDGDVRFIDPSFGWGNPALGAALYLVDLDRAGLRLRAPGAARTIRRIQADFLNGYLRESDDDLREDLRLFYPWMLLEMLRAHVEARSTFHWLLRRRYIGRLRQFLDAIARPGNGPAVAHRGDVLLRTMVFPYAAPAAAERGA